MTKIIPSINVFISSPGDVKAEREIVLQLLEDMELRPFLRGKLDIKPVAWDKLMAGTALKAKLKPQEAINRGLPLPSECDIVIVIFWSRMGTPFTAEDGTEYLSGTHWELMDALSNAQHDRIVIYRRTSPPDSLKDKESADYAKHLDQYQRMQEFFQSELFYNKDGQIQRGVGDYQGLEDFREMVWRDLEQFAIEILEEVDKAEKAPAQPDPALTPHPIAPVMIPSQSDKLYDLLIVSAPQDKDLSAGIVKVVRSLGLSVATLDSVLHPAAAAQLVDQSGGLLFLLTPQAKYAQRVTNIISNKRYTGTEMPWLPVLCAGDLQTSVPYGLMSLPMPMVDLRDVAASNNPYGALADLLERIREMLGKQGRVIDFQAQTSLPDLTWVNALNLDAFVSQAAPLINKDAPQIYVSYRSVDKAFTPPVLHGLRKMGLRVWCDQDSLKGSDWRTEIETAIEACKVMVALVSQNTIPTSWALEDLAYADAWVKPIIPLALDDTFYQNGAPYPLKHREIIRWYPNDNPIQHAGSFKRLLDLIKVYV